MKTILNGTLKQWQAYHQHWNEFSSPNSARTPRNEYYSKPYSENSYTPRGDLDIWESESVRLWSDVICLITWLYHMIWWCECMCVRMENPWCTELLTLSAISEWPALAHFIGFGFIWLGFFKINKALEDYPLLIMLKRSKSILVFCKLLLIYSNKKIRWYTIYLIKLKFND